MVRKVAWIIRELGRDNFPHIHEEILNNFPDNLSPIAEDYVTDRDEEITQAINHATEALTTPLILLLEDHDRLKEQPRKLQEDRSTHSTHPSPQAAPPPPTQTQEHNPLPPSNIPLTKG